MMNLELLHGFINKHAHTVCKRRQMCTIRPKLQTMQQPVDWGAATMAAKRLFAFVYFTHSLDSPTTPS
jgi:hypothetical protein